MTTILVVEADTKLNALLCARLRRGVTNPPVRQPGCRFVLRLLPRADSSRALMRAHKGSIRAESEPGRGSVFRVMF